MKKFILLVVVAAMFAWAVYDNMSNKEESTSSEDDPSGTKMVAEGPSTGEADIGLDKGQTAPDFTLELLSGETVSLSDYRGKKVMVNFWATWCPPCRAEMPDMEKFYNETEVEILAVNLTATESDPSNVGAFAEEFGLSFPILLDKNSAVATTYQIQPVPTSIFIDEEGRIQSIALGAMNYDMMIQRYEDL
ncbi:redoxin domain-containing protein [Thalassobacillus hwangdonensis]|uniref:Redoxin domain-containing protein n=1 Tax=Thalassobacillus hwangdonensis TaxID=546108 RepID=A0ABW3KZF4_9BACI